GSGQAKNLRFLTALFLDSPLEWEPRKTSQVQPSVYAGDRFSRDVYQHDLRVALYSMGRIDGLCRQSALHKNFRFRIRLETRDRGLETASAPANACSCRHRR